MDKGKFTGRYVRAFLSNEKYKKETKQNNEFSELFDLEENETVYIYSFKENKLIYVDGFEKLFGINHEHISALILSDIFTPSFKSFFDEYHDRILLHLYNHNNNLNSVSMSTIVRVIHSEFPVLVNTKVFEVDEAGNLISIIGRSKRFVGLKSTDVVQYSFNGQFETKFLEKIKYQLDSKNCISQEDIKLLESIEMNKDLEIVSEKLNLNIQTISNRLENLLTRFKLNTKNELIEFAKTNYLIPNQFEIFKLSPFDKN